MVVMLKPSAVIRLWQPQKTPLPTPYSWIPKSPESLERKKVDSEAYLPFTNFSHVACQNECDQSSRLAFHLADNKQEKRQRHH